MNAHRTLAVVAVPAHLRWPRLSNWLRIGGVAVSYIVAFIAVGVLLAATLPAFAGFHTVTVYGGSMGKALPAGSVAVTRPVDAKQLAVGDVIAIGGHEDGLPILHRIVGIEEVDGGRLVTTRGDANETNDLLPITIAGKGDRLVYHIPWIGYFLAFSRSQLGLALLVGIPATVWAVREVLVVRRMIKRRMEQRRSGESGAADAASAGARDATPASGVIETPPDTEAPAIVIVAEVQPVPYVFIPIDTRPNAPGGAVQTAPIQGHVFVTFVGLVAGSARAPNGTFA